MNWYKYSKNFIYKKSRRMELGSFISSQIEEIAEYFTNKIFQNNPSDVFSFLSFTNSGEETFVDKLSIDINKLEEMYPSLFKNISQSNLTIPIYLKVIFDPKIKEYGVSNGFFSGKSIYIYAYLPPNYNKFNYESDFKKNLIHTLYHEVLHYIRSFIPNIEKSEYVSPSLSIEDYMTQELEKENWLSDFHNLLHDDSLFNDLKKIKLFMAIVQSFNEVKDSKQRKKYLRRLFLTLQEAKQNSSSKEKKYFNYLENIFKFIVNKTWTEAYDLYTSYFE
ncbi:MAG: hypothetical protein ACOCV1_07355 [Bacillota bacterium]